MLKRGLAALYGLMVVLLATATFIEYAAGTEVAAKAVYRSGWFCAVWGILAVGGVLLMRRGRWWRRREVLSLHLSLVLMLAGAGLTFGWGEQGHLHLRVGAEVSTYVRSHDNAPCPLPFRLRLDSFRIRCYPGTEAPADYVSYLHCDTVAARVSMNRIGRYGGYRFYQSSFDEDRQGTWLTVNHDPWGTAVTYAGYAGLFLSMMAVLLARRGTFRRLLRHPLLRRGGWMGLVVGGLSVPSVAGSAPLPVLPRAKADSLSACQVIWTDRVAPFNTLALEVVRKVTGRSSYRGLTAEQVVTGWLLRPEAWRHEPLLLVKDKELRRLLGLQQAYVCLDDLYDEEGYRLQRLWQPSAAVSLQRAIAETDEKVGLLLMLQQGTLIRPLPADGSVRPLSVAKVRAELLYNRLSLSQGVLVGSLLLGLLAFGRWLWVEGEAGRKSGHCLRWVDWLTAFGCGLLPVLQLAGYGLRGYIAGRFPLADGFETMQFLSLCSLVLAALCRFRFPVLAPFGLLSSGFAQLVARLGQLNPSITPLMPVLASPWLSVHVSLVMMGYALAAFLCLNGVLALCRPRRRYRLMLLGRLLLFPTVFLLGAGIFVGAVWANQSWGRYWAWDPKETWALITFLVYGAAFHGHSVPLLRRPCVFHAYMVGAFLTVLMTCFGVSYFLGGLHGYAS